MPYTEQQLVALAKRENNNKRPYLVVNRLQGKHIPVSPDAALAMFCELAGLIRERYPKERLLLIGFAETATAIGAAVAAELDSLYIQTTREQVEGAEYFYFSEQHSHATEQKLVKNDFDAAGRIDRIVFIEDEITTGRTILNIVRLLKNACPWVRFSAASLLNGMGEDDLRFYEEQKIRLHYLVKTDHSGYAAAAEGYRGDGRYRDCDVKEPSVRYKEYRFTGYENARRFVRGGAYRDLCLRMCGEAMGGPDSRAGENILVLGTEEFMYPALLLAGELERTGRRARFHATTRSPIAVSTETEYPLHERWELRSLYDRERRTFVYDLEKYDKVYIVTDAALDEREGINSLVNALALCGNEKIYLIRWGT